MTVTTADATPPGAAWLDACGHTLALLPSRAVWWPAERTVVVADVHLGKGASFRALGQPVPPGSSAATLARLSALIGPLSAQRLVVLGDLWHARSGMTAALETAFGTWREAHRALAIDWVLGNHDRRALGREAEATAACWRLALHAETIQLAPHLRGAHEPSASPHTHMPSRSSKTDVLTLVGHVHPSIVLHGAGRERLRLRCYVHHAGELLLPAFGEFTGSHTLDAHTLARAGARVAPVASERVAWLEPVPVRS